jgi:hypothetical protein
MERMTGTTGTPRHRFAAVVWIALLLPLVGRSQEILLAPPPVVAPLHLLPITSIDFVNATTPYLLFTISMRTSDASTVQAKMEIAVHITLAGGERYDNAVLIRTRDPHFSIPGARTVTNLDLGSSIPVSSQIRSDAKSRLEQTALPSGVVPAGLYQFVVRVERVDGQAPPVEDSFEITLTNPSTVELLLPFDQDRFVNQFPLFQWRFAGSRSRISVFEMLPGQTSLEETASGVPHLNTVVDGNSFQYPTAGARALNAGTTYVWFVEGLVSTAGGGEQSIKSQLRSFTVAARGEASAPGSVSALLDELERVLKPEYRSVIEQLRLQGFTNSASMRLNGSPITNAELVRILSLLRNNPDAVQSVAVE